MAHAERLYVLFEGCRGDRRPVSARSRAPRTGIKVRVAVEPNAGSLAQLFLLHRRGDGDMVIKAAASREPLVELQSKLGAAYEITAVPVLQAPAV
jgi:hypothetical protein